MSTPANPAEPVLDFTTDGLRHRKWIFPAQVYEDGGASAERHYYVLGDAPFSVAFSVHAGKYPEGRGPDTIPSGSEVSWHQQGEHGREGCYALSGGTCYGDVFFLEAMEWYESAPKDADGLVPDDAIFHYLRGYYADWSNR